MLIKKKKEEMNNLYFSVIVLGFYVFLHPGLRLVFPEKCFGCESYLTIPRPSSDSFSRSTLVHRPCKNNLRSQLIICRNLTTGNPSVNRCRWQSWCWMAACVMCLWTVPVRVSVWLWLWVCVICSVLVLFVFLRLLHQVLDAGQRLLCRLCGICAAGLLGQL